jgi:hypothetical protein
VKRSELNVGDELYYARSTNWEDRSAYGQRAVVVDAGCWERPIRHWGFDNNPRPASKGNGVLVDLYSDGRAKPWREVVTLGQLKGPWLEVKTRVDKAEAQRREREAADRAEQDTEWTAARSAADRARRLGFAQIVAQQYPTRITILAADLEVLLDAYEGDDDE